MKKTLQLLALLLLITFCIQGQTQVEKYPSGKIKSEIPVKDGKKNGVAKFYYESGKLGAEVEYKNDTAIGTFKEYYEGGGIYRETDKKTLAGKIYNADSTLCLIGTYDNKKLIKNGVWEDWYIKENYKRFEWTYLNDNKHGPYTAFRKDGSVEAKGFYTNGNLSDTLKLYDEKGNIEAIEVWKVNDDGKGSTNINTQYLTDKRPEGAVEVIDGEIYIWIDGKKTLLKSLEDKK